MKNSKQYARKVQKLYNSLRRAYPKVSKTGYDEPTDAVIYAVISELTSETAAQFAFRRFADYFVDLNDLRVARVEEIVEVLGGDSLVTRQIASTLNTALMAIFNAYHTVSLKTLRRIGKRPAKQVLEKLGGTSRFVVNYCMLTALQGHAIPLTSKMIEYLRSNELVEPNADEPQIEGFLTRQISAKDAYEFYALLRHESESAESAERKKAKRKTTRRSKTKQKK